MERAAQRKKKMSTANKQAETPFLTESELQALTDGQLTSAHNAMLAIKVEAIIIAEHAMRRLQVEGEMHRRGLAVPTEFVRPDQDQQIEQQIQAKGLTAPRVTPSDIRQAITDEFYFTAAQGISAAYPIPATSIDLPSGVKLLTFCVLVLRNGFTVTGESACASPENFDEQVGRDIARTNAVNKIWMLEGYLLKERLHNVAQRPDQPPVDNEHVAPGCEQFSAATIAANAA